MQAKVTVVPGLSKKQIENVAIRLLKENQPDALTKDIPVDVEMLYEFYIPETYGIKVCYTDLSPLGSGILGYTNAATKESFVDKNLSDSNDVATSRRFRSTVVHESFHCIQHVPVIQYFKSISLDKDEILYRVKKTDIRAFEDPEWQAWEFARVYLMPSSRTIRYYESGLSVRKMADIFDVNPKFMEVRLKKMGLKNE
jgi:hypothetical protein